MNNTQIQTLQAHKAAGQKSLAVLIDPDKADLDHIVNLVEQAESLGVDWLFVGGSLLVEGKMDQLIPFIKAHCNIPVILFPGSPQQVVPHADGILFLSLISGRNPDLLIGRQVEAAPKIKAAGLEVLPTGYMLIECGPTTTAHYMSNTLPIPYNKPEIAMVTAMAGEMLGLQLIYMDGGSGAAKSISTEMIREVSAAIQIPLIVGGGIRSAAAAEQIWMAGADVIVVGTAVEAQGFALLSELAAVRQNLRVR